MILTGIVDAIPEMGGRKIGPYLQHWAREVGPDRSIVELGVWLGAGTAQLATGALDGHRPTVWGYDRFCAQTTEVVKAQAQGVSIRRHQDTQPVVSNILTARGLRQQVALVKGIIPPATFEGKPIGLHVDDACKREGRFLGALAVFGPHWIPGETVVVLMDYWYFEKKPKNDGLRFQHDWMQTHKECFDVVLDRLPNTASVAAFRYRGGEPWK